MLKTKALRIEGDQHPFMANLLLFQGPAGVAAGKAGNGLMAMESKAAHRTRRRPLHAPCHRRQAASALLRGGGRRVFRSCACTPPVPTAGNIARSSTIAKFSHNFRVIAFDMPWHGKSSPPAGWQRRRVQADGARLCRRHHDGRRSPGSRPAGSHRLLHRRAGGAASGAGACQALPRADRAGVGRPRGALLRPQLAASARRARRGNVRRTGFGSDRADRSRSRPVGDDLALHAGRAGRLQGRPALLHVRRRRSPARSARSIPAPARSICLPASTTIPARPPTRASWPATSRARRSPSWTGSATFPSAKTRRAFWATCAPSSTACWRERVSAERSQAARRSRLGASATGILGSANVM